MQSEGVDITVNLKGLFLPALLCSLVLNAAVLFVLYLIPGGASAEKAEVALPSPAVLESDGEEEEGTERDEGAPDLSAVGAPAIAADSAVVRPVRPTSASAAVPRSRGDGGESETAEYVVRRGDNFTAIAKRHGLAPAELAELNGGALSKFSRLDVGQRLRVPKK